MSNLPRSLSRNALLRLCLHVPKFDIIFIQENIKKGLTMTN